MTTMNKCKYFKERTTIFIGYEIPEHRDIICDANPLEVFVAKCEGSIEKCTCSSIRRARDAELKEHERRRELLDVTEGQYSTFFTEDEETGGLRISAEALTSDIILHGDGSWEVI